MVSKQDYIDRVRECADPDIVQIEDGTYVFWPCDNKGFMESSSLRIIADYLDEKNKPWHDAIAAYFANEEESPND